MLELHAKKRERPLLLGEELDRKVKLYLNVMRSRGAVVNASVVVGVANSVVAMEGILRSKVTGQRICRVEWGS